MPYKIPNIPIFPQLLGTEKRVQALQLKLAELDWLEYSFGLAKRVTVEYEDEMFQVPVCYIGINHDPLDMRMWPSDSWDSYAFWTLMDKSEFLYFDNVNARRRFPKIQQPVALIVCLDNQKISNSQDNNITHSLCRNELIQKLNTTNIPGGGIFEITGIVENDPVNVFEGYDVLDELMEPHSMMRIEGVITYTQDCTP